jgi:RNA polymerase sigma-70 factor (ECF subfamily)
LARVEKETGTPFHAVLQHKVQHPDEPSAQAAQVLSAQLNKPFSAAGVRQILHRAREKFAELLLDEIACSVETRARDRVEQEVLDLGLLPYCKDALDRWANP